MTQMIDRLPVNEDLVAIAERASLFALLQQALRHHLYDDLGIPPSQRPDFTPHGR